MVKVMQILLVVGCIGAFIFLAASCGGDEWVKAKFGDTTQGLWKYCISGTCVTVIDDSPGYIKACGAFAILAVLAAVGGILLAILSIVIEKMKGFFASIIMFIAAGCMALALVIFAAKTELTFLELGWSYILGWIGVIGAIASAVLGLLAEKC